MTRLGVIGKPSDWLIASNVDYKNVKNKFSIELIDIDINELIDVYNSKIAAKPQYFYELEHKNTFNKEEIDKAYILCLSIKDLTNKYNLEGLTIRCFDLLKPLVTTSCLAFALLNKEGIIATCEGDIPSMLSMYLIRKYLGVSSFQANPSQIDVDKNEILLAHCTVPLDMLTKYNLDTHFESNIGVAIQGELKHKGVYIFKLSNNLKDHILLKGDIIETPFLNTLCRTQVKIKLNQDSSVRYFLTKPLGNHHIIFYEDEIKEDITSLTNIIKNK